MQGFFTVNAGEKFWDPTGAHSRGYLIWDPLDTGFTVPHIV